MADRSTQGAVVPAGKVRFADQAAAALLGERLEALCRPDRNGLERVKSSPSRTVYRGVVGGQTIYVKHFHSHSLFHRLCRRIGVSDAMVEMRFSRHLNDHGVPAPRVLAAANWRGIEWVATAAVENAQPADAWHTDQLAQDRRGGAQIRRATVALARLLAAMHRAGVLHRDLHCGNVLIFTGPDGSPQPFLMDLHRMRRRNRLSRRARARNLAQLFHDRFAFATRTDRLRFLRNYLAASGQGHAVRGWAYLIELFARPHSRRQFANRDRRILTDEGRYFARVRTAGSWRGHVVLASKFATGGRAENCTFTAQQWADAVGDPGALLDDAQVVKNSASTRLVRRRLVVGGHELDVFVKLARRKRRYKLLLDCFRRSRSVRAFRLGHMLLARRIAVALPLACFQRRIGPFLTGSILITEALDAVPLNAFLTAWLSRPPKGPYPISPAQQQNLARELLWQLGRMLQRLHDSGFAHRDLKADNVLVRWRPGAPVEIVLVDLDGLKRSRHISTRRRFQGLMRLNVSLLESPVVNRAGRLRMLLGYLRRPGMGRIHFKPHWQALADWSAKKLRQQIRTRRKRQKAERQTTAPVQAR